MNSIIYHMNNIEQCCDLTATDTFIFSLTTEKRSTKSFEYLLNNGLSIKNIIVIKYTEDKIPDSILEYFKHYNVTIIRGDTLPIKFIMQIKKLNIDIWGSKILIDISCIKIPEIFSIIKYFKVIIPGVDLQVLYSIPYDYNFSKEPFTSYRSFIGDLSMYELFGFSGVSHETNNDLYLFMGFEGALALKVTEDTAYKELNLINNLPSFYQKYKDISIVNNYQLMQNQKSCMLYTPADNPFETYNLLENSIGSDTYACIAPLSTKPVALGVCLFALSHEKVRVVYPISQKYNASNTVDTYKTYVYNISLQ